MCISYVTPVKMYSFIFAVLWVKVQNELKKVAEELLNNKTQVLSILPILSTKNIKQQVISQWEWFYSREIKLVPRRLLIYYTIGMNKNILIQSYFFLS